jgi:hypothetical protein
MFNNFQDSSVIVIDKARQRRTLHVLSELIPSFHIGYGDKVRPASTYFASDASLLIHTIYRCHVSSLSTCPR